MSDHPDLTAASLVFGQLIDTDHMKAERRERLTAKLTARCTRAGITLDPGDIDWITERGTEYPEIDGMPADDWINHMTDRN